MALFPCSMGMGTWHFIKKQPQKRDAGVLNRDTDLLGLAIPPILRVWPWQTLGPCGAHRDPLSSAPVRHGGAGLWEVVRLKDTLPTVHRG